MGVAAQPVAYDYGGYGDTVYYPTEPGQPADANAAAYQQEVQQANQLAGAGQKAAGAAANDADWMPVGVFALMPNGQAQSNTMVQLSISKQGIVKGSYYDMVTDTIQPLAGSVDKKTQMVAWSLESNKSVVYETGLQNLTQDEGPVMVHFPGNHSQKWKMVRMEEPQATPGGPTQ